MKVVLATVQFGRRDHLACQQRAMARLTTAPSERVVVSLDREPPSVDGAHVIHRPCERPLPLAAARNLAVRHAAGDLGAELVVLLDVDCLPSPGLLAAYGDAARRAPDALLAGAVRYLPPGVPAAGPLPTAAELAAAPPHPARPAPPAGALVPEPRHELFWSLSFAVTPATHARIGGFDEGYLGYGGEDTDYAMRARAAGVPLMWVGGAEAYHQHHPVSSPPVEHLADIVSNARRFQERWATWPMEGWLRAFRDDGLVDWDPDGSELRVAGDATGVAAPGRVAQAATRAVGSSPAL